MQQISDSFIWVAIHTLFALILTFKSLILIYKIIPMEINQMFIACNDFVNTKHNFHPLKCD
jgi:hypothetical protein